MVNIAGFQGHTVSMATLTSADAARKHQRQYVNDACVCVLIKLYKKGQWVTPDLGEWLLLKRRAKPGKLPSTPLLLTFSSKSLSLTCWRSWRNDIMKRTQGGWGTVQARGAGWSLSASEVAGS